MIATNRNALLCDLAETYGIYDFKALPATTLATLSVGLRDNSRIMMHLRGETATKTELMLAAAIDRLSLLVWMMTDDARSGVNRPASLLDSFLGVESESDGKIQGFDSPEEFEKAWAEITGVKHVK